jgi:drug/metabolite transporter (DMT)-like permease
MSIYSFLVALTCVCALAFGQILFKMSSNALALQDSVFDRQVLVPLIAAMILYGLTSLAWVWVLQRVELGKVYPIMALAFVLVPLGSYVLFGERFHAQYLIGVAFIAVGIVLTIKT